MKFCGNFVFLASAFISSTVFFSPSMASAENGVASVYSGEKTANGEYAHATAFTAAHKTLPFGTFVEVTNKENGRSVIVRICSFKKITRDFPVFFAVLCSGRTQRSSRTCSHTRSRTSFGLAPVR